MNPFFLILAIVTIAGACAAMTLRSLVHCALALAIAFAGIGTLFLSLGAQFLGLAQLLVYVGAVAVLIVFVILLTQPASSETLRGGPLKLRLSGEHPPFGLIVAATLFAILGWAVLHSFAVHVAETPTPQTTIRQLGTTLMDHYIVPLEIIGLLLTAAMIGAVVIAMKETAMKETQRTR
jgi:NADH-quinone oxidoreductase subunit J